MYSFALLALVGTTALASPIASRQASLSCNNNQDDGMVYQVPGGGQYAIHCAQDYHGGDMSSTVTNTFEECIAACDATPGCVDVSYLGSGSCYMKNELTSLNPSSLVWTATKFINGVEDTPITCDNNHSNGIIYQAANAQYEIMCGVDFFGGDMSSIQTDIFEDCIKACDATSGCIDVSYNGGTCYMKNQLTSSTPQTSAWVWTAVNIAESFTQPSAPQGPSCVNNAADKTLYTSTAGVVYDIYCGIDYYGGDLASATVADFASCLDACDATDGCIDVSFNPPAYCYMKSQFSTPSADSNVWTAVKRGSNHNDFTILSVFYSDADITQQAVQNFLVQDTLTINTFTQNLVAMAGYDPLPGWRKSISILYKFGQETRTLVLEENSGVFAVPPGPLTPISNHKVAQPYSQMEGVTSLVIVDVVYGPAVIRDQTVWDNIYKSVANHEQWCFENSLMGGDPWYGVLKSAVIWYEHAGTTSVISLAGIEHSCVNIGF
ncbi:hypothetical protein K432DRAFT_356620 [Lepidopterella palustris CBS 459.81]|uniref:Apple domain-containing protein n=1 Tax=Lepidopterella palustris CBS 459.81 TaxID=1314670 RepID=A0A8E2E7D1_9PEZI|nr:hypothetical protein K432DRAFT_356620 [Lepidopterella palustris CBS 459.81]